MPDRVSHFTAKPTVAVREIIFVHSLANRGEGSFLESSARQIDLYPPTGVIARIDADAMMMFPFTIALFAEPFLKCV